MGAEREKTGGQNTAERFIERGLTYDSGMATRDQRDGAAEAEAVRIRRLREDAQRPISVNLAETIALSHELIKMADAAKHR